MGNAERWREGPMRTSTIATLSLSLALASNGCQQPAGAQPVSAAPAAPARSTEPLVEGETCMRTDDCPRGARCFDGRCQPTARSYQGEVQAERGARALATSRYQEAVDAFRAAERAYTERQIPVPSNVSCGLARALVALHDRGAAGDVREAAARALATCLASAPRGGSQADQALAGLASLAERGLDVAALDRPGSPLMTGRDPRPTPENTRAQLVFAGTGDGARATLRELIASDAVRREVTRCFLQWWETSHQNSDQGAVRVTYARGRDHYDDLMPARVTVVPVGMDPAGPDAGTNQHWLQCR